jgi:ferrous iron transport protein A
MLLKDGKVGHIYIVEKMNLPFRLQHRLEALGMTRETPILVMNRKGRGIMIIKMRGTCFALGCNITRNIFVRCENCPKR